MDIFSHGLYGGVAFGRKTKRDYITAFLFGIGPDLLAFGPFFIFAFLGFVPFPTGRIEPPSSNVIPEYIHSLYNFTHSFIIYALFFALLWFLGKKTFAKLTLGWPLHILIDMPVHSLNFFPTPFLWPVSDFHIDGVPWSNPYIFFPNIIVLLVLYVFWFFKKKRKRLENQNN
ncbi:MAG: membrane protein [Parcubacteria group bacterium Gr01-1014_46]|nr:MAG: membrane protein [Parcubacteria group bacterium Gr01-1014_46]